ncbi:MAG: glycosyltransferase family 2 protein [Acidobacteriota bacterium]
MSPPPDLSVVVPARDEEGNITPLGHEIVETLGARPFEVVFVDDGSSDGTREEMLAWARRDPRFRVVTKGPPHGKSSSLLTGFAHARGAVVGTLDGDLQDRAEDLLRCYETLLADDALDAVNGWRRDRNDSGLKRLSSRIGNGVRRRLLGSTIRDAGTGVRVLRRRCLPAWLPFEGSHRYFAELMEMAGHRVGEIPIGHRPRHAGVAKYGVGNRLGRGLADVLAVRWLKKRAAHPQHEEIEPTP